MKSLLLTVLFCYVAHHGHAEEQIIAASPSIEEFRALAEKSAVVLLCRPNKDRSALEIESILKGKALYLQYKEPILESLPKGDREALKTDGFAEICFYNKSKSPFGVVRASSYALWPERNETQNGRRLRFLALDIKELNRVIMKDAKTAEQGVASDR